MSESSYRHALSTKSGHVKVNLGIMTSAVAMLKENPSLPANLLRPLLKSALPTATVLDSKFINNFRIRVANYHAKNVNSTIVTMEDSIKLASSCKLSAEESVSFHDPMVRANFNDMFRNIMKEDPSTWTAIQFLRKCKSEVPGFDYRLSYGVDGKPTAVMYMTPRMRYNLVRYGNIMFLDSQKRQYNRHGWPYIGPVVKTNENKIAVACEAIVTSENIDTYVWVMKSMQSIENRWSPSKLSIVYADGLLTERFLNDLGISDSCILHGDYYHLFNEVWPKSENFGPKCFALIKDYLKSMLESSTLEKWDVAYSFAKEILRPYPKKIQLLNKIHSKPGYYSSYYTRAIHGNLRLFGSVPAEQNHGSIVSHLGNGAMWDIWEQLKKLCQRHQHHCDLEAKEEAKLTVLSHRFTSTFADELANEDINAKQSLSAYAYEMWHKSIVQSERLQSKINFETNCFHVWPANEEFQETIHVTLGVGKRCECNIRIDYDIQCKHELSVDPRFKLEHWSDRWLNRKQFNIRHPDLMCFPIGNMTELNVRNEVNYDSNTEIQLRAKDKPRDNTLTANYMGHQQEIINIETDKEIANNSTENTMIAIQNTLMNEKDSKVTYKDLLDCCADLCRTVSNDQDMSRSVYSSLHEWMAKLREGEPFVIKFSKTVGGMTSLEKNDKIPIPATITPCLYAQRQKRLRSSVEVKKLLKRSISKKRNVSVYDIDYEPVMLNFTPDIQAENQLKQNDDFHIIGKPKQKSYGCYLCGQSGHGRFDCTLLKKYAHHRGVIFKKNMQTERDNLLQFITNTDGGKCFKRKPQDKRVVYHEFPNKIKALILYKKFVIHTDAVLLLHISNLCVECTILGERGVAMNPYVKALFSSASVSRHLAKSGSSLILNNME